MSHSSLQGVDLAQYPSHGKFFAGDGFFYIAASMRPSEVWLLLS